MPVKMQMTTPAHEIRAYIAKGVEEQRKKVIRRLMLIGEKCVNDARLKGSYTDRTGNLRGSTGYVVIDNGTIITEGGFQPVKGSSEGPQKGRQFISKLVSENTLGIVLIVVAGMEYAKYVADKGFNVLDSAEILADKLVNDLTSELL